MQAEYTSHSNRKLILPRTSDLFQLEDIVTFAKRGVAPVILEFLTRYFALDKSMCGQVDGRQVEVIAREVSQKHSNGSEYGTVIKLCRDVGFLSFQKTGPFTVHYQLTNKSRKVVERGALSKNEMEELALSLALNRTMTSPVGLRNICAAVKKGGAKGISEEEFYRGRRTGMLSFFVEAGILNVSDDRRIHLSELSERVFVFIPQLIKNRAVRPPAQLPPNDSDKIEEHNIQPTIAAPRACSPNNLSRVYAVHPALAPSEDCLSGAFQPRGPILWMDFDLKPRDD